MKDAGSRRGSSNRNRSRQNRRPRSRTAARPSAPISPTRPSSSRGRSASSQAAPTQVAEGSRIQPSHSQRSGGAGPAGRSQLLRRFGLSVLGAHGVVVLGTLLVALIGVISYGGGLRALPAVSAQIWLTTNMASFGYNGTVLALVPALPAMLMVCFLAWRVRREVADRISLRQVRALSFAYLATPLLLTLVAWLMLYDASMVFPRLKLPNLGLALLSTLCLHLLALLWGMGTRLIRALLRRRGLPEWWVYAARLAAEYLLWLWLAGAVVVVISLLWHQSAVAQAYAIASGSAEVIALSALSVAYLPNIAWAAAGVLVGGSANIGVAEVSLFAVIPGQLPPLPVLAAIPQSGAPWAFGLLVLIPAAISVWRVLRLVRSGVTSRPYLVVVVAALVAGVLAAIGAWLLGGEIGYFGPSGTIAWMMGVLVSLWLVLPGAVVVVVLTGVPGNWWRSKDDSEPAVEPVAEPAVDSEAESTAEPVAEPAAEPVAESTAEPVAESTAENVSAPESENSDVADSASAKSDAVDSELDHAETELAPPPDAAVSSSAAPDDETEDAAETSEGER